ncbi:MAG TPA: gamma-glutamyltransferase [Solirubrobacteraceae bacterium]|jgi:gamma-glutamyltranspeptidase/glutathione hydrolase
MRGVVAAGHPVTAEAGARVLRDGGNAVDAALAAVLASFVTEPLLTGLGAGGYLLVAGAGREPAVLDFFVATPGGRRGCELIPANVSFGDAEQVFNVGPASCGVWGTPAGIAAAAERFATVPLADLAAPAVALARDGVDVTAYQAYVLELLLPIVCSSAEAQAHFMPGGRALQVGDVQRDPELGDAIELLGRHGAAPFYTGEVGTAVREYVGARGGAITAEDLAAYSAVWREPVRARYHGRDVLTNPPPAAGGLLVTFVLALLERGIDLVEAMERAQDERTPEFMEALGDPGFAAQFVASRLGATTHVSVIDADGLACSVTCTNGEGSGMLVPGTGVHVNNMMGELDLNPLGFFTHPAGRRLPSMMAPTVVLRDGVPELVIGSAGSNRIRSAVVQVIRNVVDGGMPPRAAVDAPRLHFEDGIVYLEPGIDEAPLAGRTLARFRDTNMFFGGVQAACRDPRSGALTGAGDPRRGGAAVVV